MTTLERTIHNKKIFVRCSLPSLNKEKFYCKKTMEVSIRAYEIIKGLVGSDIAFDNITIIILKHKVIKRKQPSGFMKRNVIILSLNEIESGAKSFGLGMSKISNLDFSLGEIVPHELMHIFMLPNIYPFWFSEGMAQYMSIQFFKTVLGAKYSNRFLSHSKMLYNFVGKGLGYRFLFRLLPGETQGVFQGMFKYLVPRFIVVQLAQEYGDDFLFALLNTFRERIPTKGRIVNEGDLEKEIGRTLGLDMRSYLAKLNLHEWVPSH